MSTAVLDPTRGHAVGLEHREIEGRLIRPNHRLMRHTELDQGTVYCFCVTLLKPRFAKMVRQACGTPPRQIEQTDLDFPAIQLTRKFADVVVVAREAAERSIKSHAFYRR